ncbi:MAG TPA: hypothetical protein VHI50_10890, partial [Micromonosporaceae bacterium]|nr:hypothetical protein [Micromonosporaceae bacterium]
AAGRAVPGRIGRAPRARGPAGAAGRAVPGRIGRAARAHGPTGAARRAVPGRIGRAARTHRPTGAARRALPGRIGGCAPASGVARHAVAAAFDLRFVPSRSGMTGVLGRAPRTDRVRGSAGYAVACV